jgi:hypothetical protein
MRLCPGGAGIPETPGPGSDPDQLADRSVARPEQVDAEVTERSITVLG